MDTEVQPMFELIAMSLDIIHNSFVVDPLRLALGWEPRGEAESVPPSPLPNPT